MFFMIYKFNNIIVLLFWMFLYIGNLMIWWRLFFLFWIILVFIVLINFCLIYNVNLKDKFIGIRFLKFIMIVYVYNKL